MKRSTDPVSRLVKESRCYVNYFTTTINLKKGKTMSIIKLGFINEMLKKGQESKKWNLVCRWLVGWGIGAHVITAFLFIMAIT